MTTRDTPITASLAHDPIKACEELLHAAQTGQMTGMAVVVLFRRGRYMVDFCGEVRHRTTFVRGALQDLDDCMRDIRNDMQDQKTTMR